MRSDRSGGTLSAVGTRSARSAVVARSALVALQRDAGRPAAAGLGAVELVGRGVDVEVAVGAVVGVIGNGGPVENRLAVGTGGAGSTRGTVVTGGACRALRSSRTGWALSAVVARSARSAVVARSALVALQRDAGRPAAAGLGAVELVGRGVDVEVAVDAVVGVIGNGGPVENRLAVGTGGAGSTRGTVVTGGSRGALRSSRTGWALSAVVARSAGGTRSAVVTWNALVALQRDAGRPAAAGLGAVELVGRGVDVEVAVDAVVGVIGNGGPVENRLAVGAGGAGSTRGIVVTGGSRRGPRRSSRTGWALSAVVARSAGGTRSAVVTWNALVALQRDAGRPAAAGLGAVELVGRGVDVEVAVDAVVGVIGNGGPVENRLAVGAGGAGSTRGTVVTGGLRAGPAGP